MIERVDQCIRAEITEISITFILEQCGGITEQEQSK